LIKPVSDKSKCHFTQSRGIKLNMKFLANFPAIQYLPLYLVTFLILTAVTSVSSVSMAATDWTGTWAAAPQPRAHSFSLRNQTLREVVHTSIGGNQIRIRISNAYGATPLEISSAHIAIANGDSGTVLKNSDRLLTFSGSTFVSVPPGAELISDPIQFNVRSFSDLAISLYFAKLTTLSTQHQAALENTFISGQGDFSASEKLTSATAIQSWFFISGLDVRGDVRDVRDAAQAAGTNPSHSIVAFGDSITDGVGSSTDTNQRWPNLLAERLAKAGVSAGVLNEGIGANKLLTDQTDQNQPSASGLSRFARDVLLRPGVKTVIVADGINDIGASSDQEIPERWILHLEAAYQRLAELAHQHGVKMIVGTLTPVGGSGYGSATHRAERLLFNSWLRSSNLFDGVAEFDRAIRDSRNPERMNPNFDCGDHLHPNDAGYAAMAAAVSLKGL
jgi:lysophospholipase L1-like esterase